MMKQKFEDLVAQIKKYNSKADFELIKKAYQLAKQAHVGQKRLSGEAFVNHPLAVAKILADWRLDTGTIIGGLLHDTVEEGNLSLEKVKKEFGVEISTLVDGVTKVGELKLRGEKEEIFVENLRRLIVVMAYDLRVVLIKLADRYHNLQTLYVLPEKKQKRIARETLEIFAPLAERLGIGETKGLLEDLAFPYLYSQEYKWLKKYSRPYFKKADEDIKKIKKKIMSALTKKGIRVKVHGRQKHLYSLYCKLLRPEIGRNIEKIYDLIALRIIVETVEECYAVLGTIHKLYRPVPAKGVSDFIAQPKPNGYRSIHTTVFAPKGRITEIQIRTKAMHEQAEYGVAAHWHYTSQKSRQGVNDSVVEKGFFAPTEKMVWVKELVKWQKEIVDSKEFIDSLKFDGLKHRNFIFSPEGDVFDLPADATPVDFAYAVHTGLGNSYGGAKVDGKLVSLSYKLRSGQLVEIIVNKSRKCPSRDWLKFVVTRTAKREIAKRLRKS